MELKPMPAGTSRHDKKRRAQGSSICKADHGKMDRVPYAFAGSYSC